MIGWGDFREIGDNGSRDDDCSDVCVRPRESACPAAQSLRLRTMPMTRACVEVEARDPADSRSRRGRRVIE
jgi:hypothetical protein